MQKHCGFHSWLSWKKNKLQKMYGAIDFGNWIIETFFCVDPEADHNKWCFIGRQISGRFLPPQPVTVKTQLPGHITQ